MRFAANNTNSGNGNPSTSAARFRFLTPNSPMNARFPHFAPSGSIRFPFIPPSNEQRQAVPSSVATPEPTITTPPPLKEQQKSTRPLLPQPTFKHPDKNDTDKEKTDGDMDKESAEKQTTAIAHPISPPQRYHGYWTTIDLLADRIPTLMDELLHILVKLFVVDKDSLSEVARYRRDPIKHAQEKDRTTLDRHQMLHLLRQTEAVLQEEKRIRRKAFDIEMKLGERLTSELKHRLTEAMSVDELDRIYAPYKPASEQSKAERAKALNLETPAMKFLTGNAQVDLKDLVDQEIEGLATIEKVRNCVLDIISEWLWNEIDRDIGTTDLIRKLVDDTHITVIAKMKEEPAEPKEEPAELKNGPAELKEEPAELSELAQEERNATGNKAGNKFYFFRRALANDHMEDCKCGDKTLVRRLIEPHQTLKLDRQREEWGVKVLFDINDTAMTDFSNASRKYLQEVGASEALQDVILNYCYGTLIVPEMKKNEIWRFLHRDTVDSSAYWFVKGVGDLLLAPPIPDCYILGVDPGFGHGVKVALITPDSEPVETGRFPLPECNRYKRRKHVLFRFRPYADPEIRLLCGPCLAKEKAKKIMAELADIVRKVGEKRLRIAIGDGKACRDTQRLIADFINEGGEGPFRHLEVGYRFVRECGTSVQSVSVASEHEFPTLDPLHISAVSIARRLQDAMSELVKCDPKRLGVGMYQHDLGEELLEEKLSSKTQEIVCEVGVDLNKCSKELLQHVVGLTEARAAAIVRHRKEIGGFTSRRQLLDVAEMDEKAFRQCAGFLHVYPPKNKKSGDRCYNALDATQVHPYDYPLALRILAKVGLTTEAITNGENADVNKALDGLSDAQLAETPNYEQVVDALRKPSKYDYRNEVFPNEPIFFQTAQKVSELKGDEILRGIVNNVTGFGVFVDVGVESSGLIHTSGLPRDEAAAGSPLKVTLEDIKIESRVTVQVLNKEGDRFSLKLLSLNGVSFV